MKTYTITEKDLQAIVQDAVSQALADKAAKPTAEPRAVPAEKTAESGSVAGARALLTAAVAEFMRIGGASKLDIATAVHVVEKLDLVKYSTKRGGGERTAQELAYAWHKGAGWAVYETVLGKRGNYWRVALGIRDLLKAA